MEKKSIYLFYLLLSASLLMLILNVNSFVRSAKLFLSFVFNPTLVIKKSMDLDDVSSRVRIVFNCSEELLTLKKELLSLQERIALLEPLAEEAERLRSVLGFADLKNLKGIYAAIISYNPYDRYSFVYINRGSNDGVSLYNPVLYFDAGLGRWRLIGRIVDVYSSYSKVSLITSGGFSFVVMTSKSKGLAVSEGGGRIAYKFIEGDFDNGQSVFTADTSYTFPSHLYVGDIYDAKRGADEASRSAAITFIDLLDLRYVYVLNWQPYLMRDKI